MTHILGIVSYVLLYLLFLGSAIGPTASSLQSPRRRRRSSRSTSSSTTISGSGSRHYPGSGSVTPSSLSAILTPLGSPQQPLNTATQSTNPPNFASSNHQPFLRDRSLLVLGRDENIINTVR